MQLKDPSYMLHQLKDEYLHTPNEGTRAVVMHFFTEIFMSQFAEPLIVPDMF